MMQVLLATVLIHALRRLSEHVSCGLSPGDRGRSPLTVNAGIHLSGNDRPNIIWTHGLFAVFAKLRLYTPFGCLVAQLHAQFLVNTIGSLCIDLPTLPTQKYMDAPIAKPHARLTNLLDPLF